MSLETTIAQPSPPTTCIVSPALGKVSVLNESMKYKAKEMRQSQNIIPKSLKPQEIPKSSRTLKKTTASKNMALSSEVFQKTTSPSYMFSTPQVVLLQTPSTLSLSQKMQIPSHRTQELEATQDMFLTPVMSSKASASEKSLSCGVASTLQTSLQNPAASDVMLDNAKTSGPSSARRNLGVIGKSAVCMEQTVVSEKLHEATRKCEEGTVSSIMEIIAYSDFLDSFRGKSGVTEKSVKCSGQRSLMKESCHQRKKNKCHLTVIQSHSSRH